MTNRNNDDSDAFSEAMQGVKPLDKSIKVRIKRPQASEQTLATRRACAIQADSQDPNFLSVQEVPLLDAYYPLAFKRMGVQHGVYRKLKQGKYACHARLDLHRLSIAKARVEVFEFIKDSVKYDLRTVLIIHGKGNHTVDQSALLKSYVNDWLPQLREVQAFCSAQPRHGGLGAVYVLLAKSTRTKEQNREHFNRGRTFPRES